MPGSAYPSESSSSQAAGGKEAAGCNSGLSGVTDSCNSSLRVALRPLSRTLYKVSGCKYLKISKVGVGGGGVLSGFVRRDAKRRSAKNAKRRERETAKAGARESTRMHANRKRDEKLTADPPSPEAIGDKFRD